MKKIIFEIYDHLAEQIDATIDHWGFKSRAEFFRYTAIEFLRQEAHKLPADEVLKDYSRGIRMVHKGRRRNAFE